MSGSNLPPGVTESMIPGNRPEDAEDERFYEALAERLEADGFPYPDGPMVSSDGFERAIEIARELAYEQGVADGRVDEQLAQEEQQAAAADLAEESPMMRDEMVDRAMIVATLAFLDDPAALAHAQRVAASLPPEDRVGRMVALLHDVVEDTDVTLALLHGWFPAEVLSAVAELTRPRDGTTYFDYVRGIAAGSELARRVKIADARDNLARSRAQVADPSGLSLHDRAMNAPQGRVKRYERALRILEGGDA